jgi:hypothetical protein
MFSPFYRILPKPKPKKSHIDKLYIPNLINFPLYDDSQYFDFSLDLQQKILTSQNIAISYSPDHECAMIALSTMNIPPIKFEEDINMTVSWRNAFLEQTNTGIFKKYFHSIILGLEILRKQKIIHKYSCEKHNIFFIIHYSSHSDKNTGHKTKIRNYIETIIKVIENLEKNKKNILPEFVEV